MPMRSETAPMRTPPAAKTEHAGGVGARRGAAVDREVGLDGGDDDDDGPHAGAADRADRDADQEAEPSFR